MKNIIRLVFMSVVVALAACGGGGSSSAPTAPTSASPTAGPLSTAIVLVTNVSVTVEPTASGVLYRNTLTLTEVSHRSGATIASIRVNFSNRTRNGSATFDRNDNIVTTLASGGSNVYQLNVTSDNRDAFTQVTFSVTYSDNAGVGGSFTSPSGTSITPVPAAAAPPVLAPGAPAGKYDGVYNFFVRYPVAGGSDSQNIDRFMIITNGIVSSRDGTMAGTVDNFGLITFTWLCIVSSNFLGDYRGNMNASALSGFNFGQGTYTCRNPHNEPRSWQATQAR